jgi:hypothetical protein
METNIAVELFPDLEKGLTPELADRSVRQSIELQVPVLHSQNNTPLEKMFETSEEWTPEQMKSFRRELANPFLGREQKPAQTSPATKADPATFAKNSTARLTKVYALCHKVFAGNEEMLEAAKETCRLALENARAEVLLAEADRS